ncbi:MAG: DUF296 domain-containing protein [Firmicutes bacterium]|nr:DUF296 domain-containing protein [Bacillota bacterium]
MKYTKGKVGRVFVVKVENGDDLIFELKKLAQKESIEAGVCYIIGALKEASMVTGPKECTQPPEPVWRTFSDCREILAIGTLFRDDREPVLHLHGTTGKGDQTLTGCIRGESQIYLVAEVIILELINTGAIKEFDAEFGFKMLNFLSV